MSGSSLGLVQRVLPILEAGRQAEPLPERTGGARCPVWRKALPSHVTAPSVIDGRVSVAALMEASERMSTTSWTNLVSVDQWQGSLAAWLASSAGIVGDRIILVALVPALRISWFPTWFAEFAYAGWSELIVSAAPTCRLVSIAGSKEAVDGATAELLPAIRRRVALVEGQLKAGGVAGSITQQHGKDVPG